MLLDIYNYETVYFELLKLFAVFTRNCITFKNINFHLACVRLTPDKQIRFLVICDVLLPEKKYMCVIVW